MHSKQSNNQIGALCFDLFIALFIGIILISSFGHTFRAVELPIIIGFATLILIGIDIAGSFRSSSKIKPEAVEEKTQENKLDKALMVKIIVSIAFMLATILLWQVIGYILTSIIIIIGFGLFLGVKNKFALIATAVGLSISLYLVFGSVLGIPLPWGLLPVLL